MSIDSGFRTPNGSPIAHVAAFDKGDRDDRPPAPVPQVAGLDVSVRMDLTDREKARKALNAYGITLPGLDSAFAVYSALASQPTGVAVPRLAEDVTPDQAVEILDAYIARKAAEGVAANAKAALIGQLAGRIQREHRAGVDTILAGLQKPYAKAAERLSAAWNRLEGATTLEAAAALSRDGSGVAALHDAREAVTELNALVDPGLWALKDERATGNRGEAVARLVTVAYGTTDLPLHLDRTIIKGAPTEEAPLGVPGLILAHEGELSLPATHDEWRDRLSVYGVI